MSSQNTQSQAQQNQAGRVRGTASASRSSMYYKQSIPLQLHALIFWSITAASTSRLRMGNGATNQRSSSGVQGGCRSEPPRPMPSSPAPSTISPSDSISVRGDETVSSNQNRRHTPQVSHQTAMPYSGLEPYDYEDQYAPSSFAHPTETAVHSLYTPSTSRSTLPGSVRGSSAPENNERTSAYHRSTETVAHSLYPPSSTRSNLPGSVRGTGTPSTARVTSQQPTEVLQEGGSRAAPATMGGTPTGSSRQSRAGGCSGVMPQQSAGSQHLQGISIGVPPATQMHFHYNQVDNRQLHINNVSLHLLLSDFHPVFLF